MANVLEPGVAVPEDWHHNAGFDARKPLESVISIFLAYPSVPTSKSDWHLPFLVAVDLVDHPGPARRCIHVPAVILCPRRYLNADPHGSFH